MSAEEATPQVRKVEVTKTIQRKLKDVRVHFKGRLQ